jgi:hypothetical protein
VPLVACDEDVRTTGERRKQDGQILLRKKMSKRLACVFAFRNKMAAVDQVPKSGARCAGSTRWLLTSPIEY